MLILAVDSKHSLDGSPSRTPQKVIVSINAYAAELAKN